MTRMTLAQQEIFEVFTRSHDGNADGLKMKVKVKMKMIDLQRQGGKTYCQHRNGLSVIAYR